ncbi:MAG: hypothetical protein H7256_02620 [Bdellovibrio sp.]|nr:hypothetical protein [Bdellovibrio sp.]
MIKIYLVLLVVSLFTSLSYAGFVKGNGGNTVVCKLDSGQTRTELLDIVEAKAFIAPDTLHFTNLEKKSKEQALSEALESINATLPQSSYAQWIRDFETDAVFLKNVSLGVVADSYHFVIPKNCVVEQSVLQIEPIFHEARYTINLDRWNQLVPAQKAGLMMHELIYRDLQDADSRRVRLITGYLFSDEIRKLSLDQKVLALKNLGLVKN